LDFGCFGSEAEDKLAAGTRFAELADQMVQAVEVAVGLIQQSFEYSSFAESSYLS